MVHERSSNRFGNVTAPPILSDHAGAQHGIPLVSFFAGCGGIDIGFEAAGYHHVAAFESAELPCSTLRHNRPEWKVFGPPATSGDVSNVAEVISKLERLIPIKFEGVFTGGPPCQPFSIAANQRFSKSGKNFKRVGFGNLKNGNLLYDYIATIKHFKPACFLIENVVGLRDVDSGDQLSQAIKSLRTAGYDVSEPTILNAVDYGVPQYRTRLFVSGSRNGRQVALPQPQEQRYSASSVLSRRQQKAPNTEVRSHLLDSVRRYARLDYGQRDQLGRVDRLAPDRPSKTVIAGGTKGGGRSHLHPEIPRTLSVRECARLQSFPDDFVFLGPISRQFTQVGNAVPPVLAAQFGKSIASSVFAVG